MEEPVARAHALLPAGPVDSPALPLGSPSPEELLSDLSAVPSPSTAAAPRLSALLRCTLIQPQNIALCCYSFETTEGLGLGLGWF